MFKVDWNATFQVNPNAIQMNGQATVTALPDQQATNQEIVQLRNELQQMNQALQASQRENFHLRQQIFLLQRRYADEQTAVVIATRAYATATLNQGNNSHPC